MADNITKKVVRGTRKAIKKLIMETKKNDGMLVIEKNGKVMKIKARSLK